MRGDDQPSRYPPRGVWFGLILSACAVRALAAQGPSDAAWRAAAEPLVLSADRVVGWRGPDDAQYLYLSGSASVRQGTDVLLAAKAICRIVDVSEGRDHVFEVEVYAEGNVRDTARGRGPLASDRATFRAAEVQKRTYQRDGSSTLRAAPQNLEILNRSGFLARERPPTGKAPRGEQSARRSRPKVDTMVVSAQMTTEEPPGPDDDGPAPPRGARRTEGRWHSRECSSPRPARAAGHARSTWHRLTRARPASTSPPCPTSPRVNRRPSRPCPGRSRKPRRRNRPTRSPATCRSRSSPAPSG